MKKIYNTDKAPAPVGPYNQSVAVNGMLYVSGQIAINPETGVLVLEDVQKETHQVMQNIQAVLAEVGRKFEHVVKASIFISNMDDFAKINEVYATYFDAETAPARECVEVARLPKDVNVEISVLAYL